MSMNLTLTDKTTDCDIDLWQTPTFITWMCLSYNPETKEPDGGQEGVRRRYLEWVRSHTNGVWKDVEELDYMSYMRERVREHSKIVLAVKDPEFSFI
jgi:hypothetical protein